MLDKNWLNKLVGKKINVVFNTVYTSSSSYSNTWPKADTFSTHSSDDEETYILKRVEKQGLILEKYDWWSSSVFVENGKVVKNEFTKKMKQIEGRSTEKIITMCKGMNFSGDYKTKKTSKGNKFLGFIPYTPTKEVLVGWGVCYHFLISKLLYAPFGGIRRIELAGEEDRLAHTRDEDLVAEINTEKTKKLIKKIGALKVGTQIKPKELGWGRGW